METYLLRLILLLLCFQEVFTDSGLYVRSTAKVIYGREKLRKKEKPVELVAINNSTCETSSRKNPYYLTNHENYEIVWGGEQLPVNCELVFQGSQDSDVEYKVCMASHSYNVSDCNFLLTIQGNNLRKLNKEKRCGTQPIKEVCSTPGDPLYIEFVNTAVTGANYLTIYVRAKISIDFDKHLTKTFIGIILGVILFVGISILITLVLCLRLRYIRQRKRNERAQYRLSYDAHIPSVDYDTPYVDELGTETKTVPKGTLALFTATEKQGAINKGFDVEPEIKISTSEKGTKADTSDVS